MPVREVALKRDIRAPVALVPGALVSRYNARRALRAIGLLLFDVASLVFAVTLGPRFWQWLGVRIYAPSTTEKLVAGAVVVAVAMILGLYRSRAARRGVLQVWKAAIVSVVLLGLIMMVAPHTVTPKSVVLLWALFVASDTVLRAAAYVYLRRTGAALAQRPALLVGRPEQCETSAARLHASTAGADVSIVGMVTDGPVPQEEQSDSGLRALGSLAGLEDIVDRHRPTDLILGDPDLVRDRMGEILETARRHRLTVHMMAPDMGFAGTRVCYVPGFGMPVFVVQPTTCGRAYIAKRVIDLVLAGAALLLLTPLLLVVAAVIKLTSRGPVLYTSERVGLGQRRFRCYKFRSMYVDAEQRQAALETRNEADGAIFKIRDDPRLTPIGSFLRKKSIDELPQLLNVLKGDMSMVGPRPLPLRDNELMEDWHKHRHVVLPGLTGLWQISGRSDLSFDEMIEFDLRYIENWSLRNDLTILARTVGVVLFGRGAY